jgi:hypothetical protein
MKSSPPEQAKSLQIDANSVAFAFVLLIVNKHSRAADTVKSRRKTVFSCIDISPLVRCPHCGFALTKILLAFRLLLKELGQSSEAVPEHLLSNLTASARIVN